MAKEELIEMNGVVSEALPDSLFRVTLENGHVLVVDDYVQIEARRNLTRTAAADAIEYLDALLAQIEVNHVQHSPQRAGSVQTVADCLPDKDRPVLLAAIALQCEALVTGDRTDFGAGFGQAFGGVTIYSPAQFADVAFGL